MAVGTPLRHILRAMNRTYRGAAHAVLGLLLGATACDFSTEPEVQKRIDVSLDFCASRTPIFFAYLNQDEEWTRVNPSAAGTFAFTATNRVIGAYVYQTGINYETEIIAAANTELEAVSGLACVEQTGTKSVSGSVAGVSGTQISRVSMSVSGVTLLAHQTTFGLSGLPDRLMDFVGSRLAVSGAVQQADRIRVLRAVNPSSGAVMPTLDFAASDAIVPATNTAQISGILSGDAAYLVNNLFTQLGTSQILTYVDPITTTGTVGQSFSSLPASAQVAGDFHDIFIIAAEAARGARGAETYFRAPRNVTLPLGPPIAEAVISTVAATPYVRLRAQMNSQLDYSGYVSVRYDQTFINNSTTAVTMYATPGYYRGRPATWDLTLPDLSGVTGWQNGWGLQAGTNIDWAVTAVGGRSVLLLGAPPNDGELLRYAARTSASLRRVNDPATALARVSAMPLRRPAARGR
jgi:hypothetical protein